MGRAGKAGRQARTRRRFLGELAAAGCVFSTAGGYFGLASVLGGDARRGLINCSPPPPPKPQHRTGGESFPPLPLPATPLRRTEKKRPPSPPALVGKMVPIQYASQGGKRVPNRDWQTDVDDVNTLLEWTRAQLGVNYGEQMTNFEEFSYDCRELPGLLFSGHNAFTLNDDIRTRLGRYVLDGGTIIGDACCGWEDFNESFRLGMESVLPGRPLRKLDADDPVLASYYKLGRFSYQRADGGAYSRYEDEPCIEGIMIGCRLGVIYSPVDLTCGWSGHDHSEAGDTPRGLRVAIAQARQVGANFITYLLGNYQLARFLSTTKVYHEAQAPTRDDVVLAQIVHEGDWDPDPSAVYNLLRFARDNSTMEVKFKRASMRLKDPQAARQPILYMTGHHDFRWDEQEGQWLRRYLKAGGTLIADACCGRLGFDSAFRREMEKVLPGQRLAPVPLDHPVYHCHFDIDRAEYTPRTREDFGDQNTPSIEGVSMDGRLAVAYSRFDLGDGWEQFPHPYSYGYAEKDALQIGTNLLVYAVTH